MSRVARLYYLCQLCGHNTPTASPNSGSVGIFDTAALKLAPPGAFPVKGLQGSALAAPPFRSACGVNPLTAPRPTQMRGYGSHATQMAIKCTPVAQANQIINRLRKETGMHRIAYADEANWNQGRYRAVAAISLPKSSEAALARRAQDLLSESDVTEFAWKHLRDARYGFAAKKLLEMTVHSLGVVRIDVLCWDVEDHRHARHGRDDIANLERMYHWLFRKMGERHPSTWTLRPDTQSAIDWVEVHDVLVNSSRRHNRRHDSFEDLTRRLEIQRLSPTSSSHPFIQIADLFAGMTIFSRRSYDRFVAWCNSGQLELVPREGPDLSKSEIVRCEILNHFDRLCKDKALGVSLRTERGLRSRNPKSPVNFWWWTPQSAEDSAPLRKERRS